MGGSNWGRVALGEKQKCLSNRDELVYREETQEGKNRGHGRGNGKREKKRSLRDTPQRGRVCSLINTEAV